MMKTLFVNWTSTAVSMAVMLFSTGCQSVYYDTMEKFGYEKRDLLVDNVEEAKEAQEEAKEQFASALDQFIAVTGFDGGELQDRYEKLKEAYEDSEARAEEVRDRIDDVDRVAEDLFEEWEDEIGQYQNEKLRRNSQLQLRDTKAQYSRLIKAMKRAEKKMSPVLAAFNDQVLYLKHNLNARAIASLRKELGSIETDIASLIRDMNASISEAERFINAMQP